MKPNYSKIKDYYEDHDINIGAPDDLGDCALIIDGQNTDIYVSVYMWEQNDPYAFSWIKEQINIYLSSFIF